MLQRGSSSYLLLLFLALLSCASLALASTPTSFCKCTCFSNSTIIPLDPAQPETTSALNNLFHIRNRRFTEDDDTEIEKRTSKDKSKYRPLSCTDCNRKFCLDYDLPTCKNAKEEDVFTTCFQRDSAKDEAIVFIFIFATSGLLAWAVFKPWVEKWIEAARERRSYIPVSENET